MKSPINNINSKTVDTIEEKIWQSTVIISKKLDMNTSQENIDKLMESFHEFMLDYKGNPKNKDFINDLLRGEDEIPIYTLMLFQKDNGLKK